MCKVDVCRGLSSINLMHFCSNTCTLTEHLKYISPCLGGDTARIQMMERDFFLSESDGKEVLHEGTPSTDR